MISVTCGCGKRLRTGEKYAGRTTKCPNCGEPVTFPKEEEDLSAYSAIRIEDDADESADAVDAVAPLPESAPPLPAYTPPEEDDEPEPSPMARKAVDTRPAFKPYRPDREPLSYTLVDVAAALLVLLGIGQFVLTLFATVLPAVIPPAAPPGAEETAVRSGPDLGVAFAWGGSSFMAMIVIVAFAGAVMVLVDLARVMRGVRGELRSRSS